MFTDNIVVTREAVKKYGATGAIVLQVLYTKYGTEIPRDYEAWKPLFKGLMSMSVVKSSITKMYKDRRFDILDDVIYLEAKRKKEVRPTVVDVLGEESEEKAEKKANPVWDMATVLCKVVGQDEKFYTQNKYLRFAKQLLEHYTIEFVEKRYSKGGEWYKYEWKGQQGSPPTTYDIRKTISKKYTKTATTGGTEKKSMWS